MSSKDLQDEDPIDYWRSAVSRTFYPFDLKDFDRQVFEAEFQSVAVGDITISRFEGTGHTVIRPPNLIRSSDADFYLAAILMDGTQGFDHHGRNIANGPGDIVLIDVTRPFEVAHGTSVNVLSVEIPRHMLDEALGATRAAVGLTLDGRSAETSIVRDFLLSLERNADALDTSIARRMAGIGVDLIAASFARRMAALAPGSANSAAMVVRARAFIESNATDPTLDVERIASAVGVSPRRLHEVFAEEGSSIIDYLWERRLLRARKLLADHAGQRLKIGAIAHLAGFASQAHFNRRFKQRFGMTPSDFIAACDVRGYREERS